VFEGPEPAQELNWESGTPVFLSKREGVGNPTKMHHHKVKWLCELLMAVVIGMQVRRVSSWIEENGHCSMAHRIASSITIVAGSSGGRLNKNRGELPLT
jgi:hypothetical protein